MYQGLHAGEVTYNGHGGDEIDAYYAKPDGPGPFPGVVVIHHMPGWDEATMEITRKFAHHGYAAICPHLYSREATPEMTPEEAAAAVREQGGVPDERMLGDVGAAAEYLRNDEGANGKVGVIGYCSGGRQSFLAACSLELDAAVDCYGGRVVASNDELSANQPVAPIDLAANLSCPILCLFGADDKNPSPEHQKVIEETLRSHGKTFETHSYENTGHSFFSVDRPAYRVESANDGWERIFSFFGRYLADKT